MPDLDRNSIGLNAVCCCLFIDKTFQRTNPRVVPLCAPPAKGIHIRQSEFWPHCARNIATFVEIERFWAGGCDQKYPTMLLRRILACNAERQWTSPSSLYVGQKREAAERRSVFCRALQELPAEGGGEVRRASESAAQSNIKSAFISIAKHRFRSLHS